MWQVVQVVARRELAFQLSRDERVDECKSERKIGAEMHKLNTCRVDGCVYTKRVWGRSIGQTGRNAQVGLAKWVWSSYSAEATFI